MIGGIYIIFQFHASRYLRKSRITIFTVLRSQITIKKHSIAHHANLSCTPLLWLLRSKCLIFGENGLLILALKSLYVNIGIF